MDCTRTRRRDARSYRGGGASHGHRHRPILGRAAPRTRARSAGLGPRAPLVNRAGRLDGGPYDVTNHLHDRRGTRRACRVASSRSTVAMAVLPRVLWAAFSTSLVLAVLALTRPAFAMPDERGAAAPVDAPGIASDAWRRAAAGFCDDRAASAIAAPPMLEAPDQAPYQAIGRAPASCADEDRTASASISPEHRSRPRVSVEAWYALIPVSPGLVRPESDRREPSLSLAPACHAVYWRIERPPRG